MRTKGVTVKGFREVERNLNRALDNMKINSLAGLNQVARVIHGDADITPPTIPVETGNLRRSRFIVDSNGVVSYGKNVNFVPRGKGKQGGTEMASHHVSVITKMKIKAKSSRYPKVIFGYSAGYAVFPHEMGVAVNAGTNIQWTRPGSGAKFFQAAMLRKTKATKRILYRTVNIKGKRKPDPVKGIKYGATIGGKSI